MRARGSCEKFPVAPAVLGRSSCAGGDAFDEGLAAARCRFPAQLRRGPPSAARPAPAPGSSSVITARLVCQCCCCAERQLEPAADDDALAPAPAAAVLGRAERAEVDAQLMLAPSASPPCRNCEKSWSTLPSPSLSSSHSDVSPPAPPPAPQVALTSETLSCDVVVLGRQGLGCGVEAGVREARARARSAICWRRTGSGPSSWCKAPAVGCCRGMSERIACVLRYACKAAAGR